MNPILIAIREQLEASGIKTDDGEKAKRPKVLGPALTSFYQLKSGNYYGTIELHDHTIRVDQLFWGTTTILCLSLEDPELLNKIIHHIKA